MLSVIVAAPEWYSEHAEVIMTPERIGLSQWKHSVS